MSYKKAAQCSTPAASVEFCS